MIAEFRDVLAYPWRGSGKYVLFFGWLLMLARNLVEFAPGIVGLIAVVLIAGYLIATQIHLIHTSATGSSEAAEFPPVSDVKDDLVMPFVHGLAAAVISFLPLFLVSAGEKPASWIWGALGYGIVVFPMTFLAVAVLGTIFAISPHRVFPAIFRAGSAYLPVVAQFAMLVLLEMKVGMALRDHFWISGLLMPLVSMWILMMNARALGLLYRAKEDVLGWV